MRNLASIQEVAAVTPIPGADAVTYGLPDEDLAAASELIAEAYDGGRYVRARDAAMDLLGKYLSPDETHDIVTLGQAALRREAEAA